jgi:hypothetical protein
MYLDLLYKFAKELFLLEMMVHILFNALSFKMSEDPSFYVLMTAKHKISRFKAMKVVQLITIGNKNVQLVS